jgi:hypothetical protein
MSFIHRSESSDALLGEWTWLVEIYFLTSLDRSFRSLHVHRSIYRRYSQSDYPHRNRPRRIRTYPSSNHPPPSMVFLPNPSWLRANLPCQKNTDLEKGKDVVSSARNIFSQTVIIIRVVLLLQLRNRNTHQST